MPRRTLVWTIVLVAALFMTSCAPAATPVATQAQPTAPAAATAQPVVSSATPAAPAAPAAFDWQQRKGEKLRVAMVDQAWTKWIQKSIPEFKALTGIDVTYEILPEDQFRQKTTVEFASGTSDVDVILSMAVQEGIKYESAGWYADIEKLLNNPKVTDPQFDFKDFTPSGLRIARLSNGKLIGLPVYNEFGALFYNKELFDKAKLPYPPKTLDEVMKDAEILNNPKEGIFGFTGRGKGAAATSQFTPVMWGFGADFIKDGKAGISDPKFIQAVQWWGDIIRKYGPPGSTAMTWNQCQDLFMQGKAAMWLDGASFFANVTDPAQSKIADKVGVAAAPAGPAGQVPWVGGWHLSIYNGSKHQEAAWLFIQWALSKDMVKRAQLANIPTGRVSAWNSDEFKKQNKYPDMVEAFLTATKIGNPQWNPAVLNVAEARDAIGTLIVTAIEGGDLAKPAPDVNKKVQALLDATPKLK